MNKISSSPFVVETFHLKNQEREKSTEGKVRKPPEVEMIHLLEFIDIYSKVVPNPEADVEI